MAAAVRHKKRGLSSMCFVSKCFPAATCAARQVKPGDFSVEPRVALSGLIRNLFGNRLMISIRLSYGRGAREIAKLIHEMRQASETPEPGNAAASEANTKPLA